MRHLLGAATAALCITAASWGPALAEATNGNQLSDPRVRQAIAYAIDMDTIIATLLEGNAIRAAGLLPNGPFKSPEIKPYPFDPEKARQLLKEAGWDSSRELDLVFYYEDQLTADMMAAFQVYLADVGIKMNYRLITGDTNAQLLPVPADPVNGPAAVTWDLGYGAKAALALQEYYNGLRTGNSAHTPGSPELDGMIDAINATSDPAKQKEAFFVIEEYVHENLQSIPLYYQQLTVFESDRLSRNGHGYGNDQYNYDWGIIDWTVTPDETGKAVMSTNTAPAEFFELPWYQLGIGITNKAVFDTILVADTSMQPAGGELAESYSVSEDGLTVTLTMRDGLKWHDGEALTADDVAWSLKTAILTPGVNSTVANTVMSLKGAQDYLDKKATDVEGIKVDGKTITLTFAKLDPNVLMSLTQFAPLPPKYFEGVDPVTLQQAPFWQKPIGSGPFMVNEVKMNEFTTYVPFPDYWGGVAKIEEIVAFPSDGDSDPNLMKNAEAKKLDYGFTKATSDVTALKGLSFMHLTAENIPYTRMLWINHYPRE
jgi:peptide/nickel transport system substrate-binding protein